MALAKERATRNAQHGSIQARGGPPMQGFDGPPLEFMAFKGHHSAILEDGYTMDHLPTLSELSSNGLAFGAVNSPMREAPPMASSFKTGHWAYSSSSVLSFEQGDGASDSSYSKLLHEEEGANWVEAMDHDYQANHLNSKCGANSRLARDASCTEMASVYGSRGGSRKDGRHGDERLGLLYSDLAAVDNLEEGWGQDSGSQKRAYTGDDMHDHKKHCGNGKKAKSMAKASTPTKEPQSIAAKNRRERISDRLRVLQELVPNGTKVDLVTMLEKAISYVKFLQLQVKVLATDEFWPTQGGKAPEVAQVKEAIDAILASNREKP